MAIITCPECGTEVSDRAAACPKCGNPLQQPLAPPPPVAAPAPAVTKKKSRGCLPWVIGGGVLLALFIVYAAGPGSSRTPTQQTTSTVAPAGAQATAAPKAPAAKPTDPPKALPKVGDTAEAGNWAIKLDKVESFESLGSFTKTKAQGKFVVVTITATNKHKETSTLSQNDFQLKGPDGTAYQLSSDGNTALVTTNTEPKPLFLVEQIQPGLSKQFRLVFDVNPAIKTYMLEAARIQFQVEVP